MRVSGSVYSLETLEIICVKMERCYATGTPVTGITPFRKMRQKFLLVLLQTIPLNIKQIYKKKKHYFPNQINFNKYSQHK